MAYIKAISYYLPETILTNEQLVAEFPEWTVKKVAGKVGVNQRHIAGNDECASDMAIKAAQQLFSEHQVDKSTIDYVLFCTQSPDYILPTSACIIQDKLGLSTSCGALDFNLGCSGYVYGLSLAKGLIAGGIAKNVLLLTAETYTKHIHPTDKGNRTIFGDAATATLVSTEGFAAIADFSLGTDGSGFDKLIVKTRGCRNPQTANDLSDYLYMDGPEIFNFTLDRVPSLVKTVLAKNNILHEDVDLFIFHQANQYMLDFLKDTLKIDDEKFYGYLSEVGNTVSSTIPLAMYFANKEGVLLGNVVIAGFGVGYSWGGCLLKITNYELKIKFY
ncbi:3-oxoacyl-ACP synthase [Bacteroidia bacterium]|nr:3-oxoacyl-ACP synthase [Bacteroidia bacterium]